MQIRIVQEFLVRFEDRSLSSIGIARATASAPRRSFISFAIADFRCSDPREIGTSSHLHFRRRSWKTLPTARPEEAATPFRRFGSPESGRFTGPGFGAAVGIGAGAETSSFKPLSIIGSQYAELRPAHRSPGPPQQLGRHGPPPFPGSQPHFSH